MTADDRHRPSACLHARLRAGGGDRRPVHFRLKPGRPAICTCRWFAVEFPNRQPARSSDPRSRVHPCGWTVSGRGLGGGPGVSILEPRGAETAWRRAQSAAPRRRSGVSAARRCSAGSDVPVARFSAFLPPRSPPDERMSGRGSSTSPVLESSSTQPRDA